MFFSTTDLSNIKESITLFTFGASAIDVGSFPLSWRGMQTMKAKRDNESTTLNCMLFGHFLFIRGDAARSFQSRYTEYNIYGHTIYSVYRDWKRCMGGGGLDLFFKNIRILVVTKLPIYYHG